MVHWGAKDGAGSVLEEQVNLVSPWEVGTGDHLGRFVTLGMLMVISTRKKGNKKRKIAEAMERVYKSLRKTIGMQT